MKRNMRVCRVMKKKWFSVWGIILLLNLLNGCGATETEKEDYQGKKEERIIDWNPAYRTDSPYQFIVGAESGYYIALQNYLYYVDKDQMEPLILCSNPNCKHDGKECNAYFPQSIPQITYCNGYIYGFKEESFGGSEELTAVSSEGETKESLVEVKNRDVNQFLVHREWVYYVINDGTEVKLIGYDIQGKEEQILYSIENEGSEIGGLFCWNDFLYFYAVIVDESENSNYILLRYDRNENSILEMDIKDEDGIPLNYPTVVWAEKEKVFITGISEDRERRLVYTTNMDGTDTKMEMDLPYGGLVMDDTYTYIQYWRENRIEIYDRNSECVNILSDWNTGEYLKSGLPILESGSKEYAFLFESGLKREDNPISERSVWILDKKTIGSEECQFQQILSSY